MGFNTTRRIRAEGRSVPRNSLAFVVGYNRNMAAPSPAAASNSARPICEDGRMDDDNAASAREMVLSLTGQNNGQLGWYEIARALTGFSDADIFHELRAL
jgi:hypothetical protein